jgi:23S rRNA (adenine2503-C2)-methyltransferase
MGFGHLPTNSSSPSSSRRVRRQIAGKPAGKPAPEVINDLAEEEIRRRLAALGEPGYRARQICEWLYRRRAASFDEMTNLPLALRGKLAELFTITRLAKEEERASATDGAVKFALGLSDGERIEAVFLPQDRGATLCISTQVGCAFKCRFCATGRLGLRRNLSAGEIVDQVLFVKDQVGESAVGGAAGWADAAAGGAGGGVGAEAGDAVAPVEPRAAARPGEHQPPQHKPPQPDQRPFSNVVLMGMGEPLANYDNVVKAIDLLIGEVGIGARHITVSTAGVADKIMRLAETPHEVGLAVSINSPSDDVRREVMPVAGRTPLSKIMAAARYYAAKKGRMPTFEYVLIPDLNDSVRDAHALANLMKDVPAKINLIAFNPFPGAPYERPDETRVRKFQSVLRQRGKRATLRKSLGCDILAGCGQLGQKPKRPREV